MYYNYIIITNCYIPYNTLNKNHDAIFYHMVREDMDVIMVNLAHTPGKYNPYVLINKSLVTQKHYPLIKELLD